VEITQARLRTTYKNQAFSHYVLILACDILLKTSFVEGETGYFSHGKDPLLDHVVIDANGLID
jgi:hypothetical protein